MGKVPRRIIIGEQNQSRLGAELAGAQGHGSMEAGGDLFAALAQGAGKNEYRVYAAHFGKHRDRVGTRSGGLAESVAAGARAGEAYGLDGGMPDEFCSDFKTSIKEKREDAFRERVLAHGFAHNVADQLGSSRMSGMSLDDDGIAGGEGGGSIAASNGKSDGE